MPEALAQTSEPIKSVATYDEALAGVDVAYSATPEGVKEDVILAGPSSPTSFDFTVVPSPGLTAEESGGGIDFVDAEGTTKAAFAAPFAYDAAFEDGGAEESFTEDAVTLRIVERSPQLVVRLAADPAWLSAPGRAWPVVIDPVLTINPENYADTYLRQAYPDTNYGSSSRILLGSGTEARRPLIQREVPAAFDEPVTVSSAEVQLYATTDTTGQAASPVGAYEASTNQWNPNQVTWNNRFTSTAWASPGGDFKSQPLFVDDNVTGAPGWRTWTITSAVQAWLDGERPDPGVLLKYVNESSGALLSFASSNDSDASLRPRLVVRWEALAGQRDHYSTEDFDLGAAGATAPPNCFPSMGCREFIRLASPATMCASWCSLFTYLRLGLGIGSPHPHLHVSMVPPFLAHRGR